MIYKRFAQNWFAIAIELAIVVVGVFIGTWVPNWNTQRIEQAETRRMLVQLKPAGLPITPDQLRLRHD